MANTYSSTALLEARRMISDENNRKFDLRPVLSDIVGSFMRSTDSAILNLADIKAATTQTTSALYKTRKSFTMNSSKSCSPSGETAGSGALELTWAKKGFAVALQEKKFHGNELTSMQALANDLYQAERDFWFGASGIDAALVAYMEANKTQVNAISASNVGHNTWNSSTYQVEVSDADKSRFYNYLMAEMAANNYSPNYMEFAPTIWEAERQHFVNQGAGNSTNTSYQFNGVETVLSNLITPTGYNNSVNYIIPEGGVGFVTWNEMLNREGKNIGDKEWGMYESMFYPGVYFDLFKTYGCSDTTNDGGSTQDLVTTFEMTLNYSISKQPLTTSNESPIFKYVVLNS